MKGLDSAIGRLLIAVTYVAAALLVIGVLLMIVGEIPPLSGGPALDLGSLVGDLGALAPAGFLWLGLIAVIATPISRVAAAAVGYGLAGDRRMVAVAILILLVIATAIVTSIVAT